MIIWYRNSFLASVVSILSSLMVICGVGFIIDGGNKGDILPVILFIAVGVGGMLLGKWISDRKFEKQLKAQMTAKQQD